MIRLPKAAAALVCVVGLSAFAQTGVRYDGRITTVASNIPFGANAPVMAIPNASVTICADGACTAQASIFSNQGLTVQTANPIQTDGQGRFGFWAAAGSYFYKVALPSGTVQGIYPFTLGGSAGGATLPTNAPVFGLTATTSRATVFSDLVPLWNGGTCSGFLKSDGTCAAAGGVPAGAAQDVQTKLNGTSFNADTGLFTYNSATHLLSAPNLLSTGNQTLDGVFFQQTGNLPVAHQVGTFSSAGLDGFGGGSNTSILVNPGSWGVGKNVGNATGFGTAQGWRTLKGLDIEMFGGSSGILQGIHLECMHFGSGDTGCIYAGNSQGFTPSMWTAASDEGTVGININGSQLVCIANGTITSTTGTGDKNPVFNITAANCNGGGQLLNDGIIIDTSVTLLHTALTGTVSSLWESNAFQIGSLAVTAGTAVLSTGIGVVTTADIPASTVPGTYQTQNFSSTIHDGLPLAVGPVVFANASSPEQCNILTVSGSPTQTGTISCAKFHPVGSYIFQGGTQGFGDFDDDITQMGLHSAVYVLGATDTSHLIIAQRQAGAFSAINLPYKGGEPAGLTLTGGFTVHPGALCTNTNSTNTACTLEFNTVAWSAGHSFASPTGIPTLENLGNFASTQSAPDSPQSPGSGININFTSNTQHGAGHAGIRILNSAALSKYANSGVGTGWLAAPPAIDVQGAMGNLLQFDMALPDTSFGAAKCNGPLASIICYKNSRALVPNINLFSDAQGSEKIVIDGAATRFRFSSWSVLMDHGLEVDGALNVFDNSITVKPSAAANNTVIGSGSVALTSISGGADSINFNTSGFAARGIDAWDASNGAGLPGVLGLYDAGTSVLIWNTNPTDDMFFNTPISGGNVSAGVGATAKIDHLGNSTFKSVTITGSGSSISTGTASNTDLAGQLTLAAGSATYTFAASYTSAPICVATDTTAVNAVKAGVTTTVLTITGTGTDVINYVCVGRN